MKVPSGLRVDSPSWPLLRAGLSYQGITTLAGDALGTTLVDGLCSTAGLEPSYVGQLIKLLSGDAAGSVRQIAVHNLATGTITVAAPWTDYNGAVYQVPASTQFVILSITGGGGAPPPAPPAPGVSLWMFGVCDPGMGVSLDTLVLTNLAGFNDDIFNNEFWIQVIHNASVPGAAPEREIRRVLDYAGATGTFTTDPFSANVMANDLVCVFHESIMSVEILGFGTIDTSSATVPADSARPGLYAWEVNNYFRGCLLMTTEGTARFAPRRIVEYTNATGVFTLDPNNPFPAASGDVDYIIIGDQAEFVPAADGANNRTPSDVTGNKTSTPIFVADNVSDQIRYLKGLLASINAGLEPSENLIETWQDLLIDPNIWTETDPAGAAWTPGVLGAFLRCDCNLNADDFARLVGNYLWELHTATPNTNYIIKKTIMEFTLILGVPANLDNTLTFFGWTPDAGNTRASDNIIGFCLLGDVLATLTDLGSGETENTTFGETLTNLNKFRIEVYEGFVDFYLNEVRIAQHTTNIPNVPSYPNICVDTDGDGACSFSIGTIKIWYEMVERY